MGGDEVSSYENVKRRVKAEHGTGKPITIKALAETLTKLCNKPNLQPYISNEYRKSDIRHRYAA